MNTNKNLSSVFTLILALFISGDLLAQCPNPTGGTYGGGTITTACTVSGNLRINGGSITISPSGSLSITGNFTNDKNGDVTINGGTFTTTGSFTNTGSGEIYVIGGGILDVGTDYLNKKNGVTTFTDGTIDIGGDFINEGNGNISSDGVVNVKGDFTLEKNSTLAIGGGLAVGGTATFEGNSPVTVADGGVFQAATLVPGAAPVTVQNGGTIYIPGGIPETVTVDGSNPDTNCANNCCGAQCTPEDGGGGGDALSGSGNETLPIDLLSFDAVLLNNAIEIKWISASELNNDFYEIERAVSGGAFETIARIEGAGTSDDPVSYTFKDYMHYNEAVYYRLKQTDYDGQFEYFKVVSVSKSELLKAQIKLTPNKVHAGDEVRLSGIPFSEKTMTIKLMDLSGKLALYIELTAGASGYTFRMPQVDNGLYFLIGSVFGEPIREKIIIAY